MAQINKNTYTFNNMYADILDNELTKLNDKFGACCRVEGVILDSSPMTPEEENAFLHKMDEFPVSKETFYLFRNCDFMIIPDFAKRDLINLFLYFKNNFHASIPSIESLSKAREALGMLHNTSIKAVEIVSEISDEEDLLIQDISGYDFELLLLDAKQEYQGTEFQQFYDNATLLDKAVIIVDFLLRHAEVSHILEGAKALRQKIRTELKLSNNAYVGF